MVRHSHSTKPACWQVAGYHHERFYLELHLMNTPSLKLQGKIIAAFGRHYLAELPDGEILECVPRGKKSDRIV